MKLCCCCFLMFYLLCSFYLFFFFFKQKTAYEMRISDWSSDVCSSDLAFTLWPALRRLRHMGPPMFPRPMKPIVVMAVLPSLLCCRLIFERQVVPTERGEVAFDLRLANFFEYRRSPARRLVLVDHHGTHPFERSEEHTSELQSLMRN